MAGVHATDVNDVDSLATIRASIDLGVNFFDTAYCYGPNGESENLLRQALVGRRDEVIIATKGGIHYGPDGVQTQDARPETLLRECDESLRRLGTDRVELYYLHAPDPKVPVAESAGAVSQLMADGKVLAAGASNCNLAQIREFHAICPLTAVQLPYNMLQRDIEQETVPWCRDNNIAVVVYWALMKGLLAGRLNDLEQLPAVDARRKYPMYQGEEWEKNQDFVARIRQVAAACGRTVADVVMNWTIHQPGITVALCGAKRPSQIAETAAALGWQLSAEQMTTINDAIAARGKAACKRLFQ